MFRRSHKNDTSWADYQVKYLNNTDDQGLNLTDNINEACTVSCKICGFTTSKKSLYGHFNNHHYGEKSEYVYARKTHHR